MDRNSIRGFMAVKRSVLEALDSGAYQHEARGSIDTKNLLATGEVSAVQVAHLVRRSSGTEYTCSPHHRNPKVDCHIIRTRGWYVKFYFLDPETMFISVHPMEQA